MSKDQLIADIVMEIVVDAVWIGAGLSDDDEIDQSLVALAAGSALPKLDKLLEICNQPDENS